MASWDTTRKVKRDDAAGQCIGFGCAIWGGIAEIEGRLSVHELATLGGIWKAQWSYEMN